MRQSLTRMLVAAHASLACCVLVACATGSLPDEQLYTNGPDQDGGSPGAEGGDPSLGDSGPSADESATPGAPDSAPDVHTTPPIDAGGAVHPLAGEVVVSEVLFNPAGTEPNEEWFELYNPTGVPKLLSGLVLHDGGGRTHSIPASPVIVIQPAGYFLFVHTKSAATAVSLPGAALAYEYGEATPANDIQLTNGTTGGIFVYDGATQIAQSNYGPFAFTSTQTAAVSIELKPLTNAASLVKANWCLATTAWPGGNGKGTPSTDNDCP
jgi:hypothetical protein